MDLESYSWWSYLEIGQKEGLKTAFALLAREKVRPIQNVDDYSFIIFPAAKAYEGFLKKLFRDLGFLTQEDYEGDRFRIGKALNPVLEAQWRHESIYDKLTEYCKGKELPDKLWETWKKSRNSIFHFWPLHKNEITLQDAEDRLSMIVATINSAFTECKTNIIV